MSDLKPTCSAKFFLQAREVVSRAFSSLTLVILLAIAVMFHKSSILTYFCVWIYRTNTYHYQWTPGRSSGICLACFIYLPNSFCSPEKIIILSLFRTQCQDECRIQSHSVSKILRACRNFGRLIAYGQEITMIHSFPTLYIMGGCVVVVVVQTPASYIIFRGGYKKW